jgi:hypothetical protein
MFRSVLFIVLFLFSFTIQAQTETPKNDSIKRIDLLKEIGQGFLPSTFFKFDLRYLVKYNQYEGFRSGIGGITNDDFSKKFRINSYIVYGFVDQTIKYSVGGGYKVAEDTNTWINYSYTDDLTETGSTQFILDKRFFQFFEPRLLNISLFHRHVSNQLTVEHEILPQLLSEFQVSVNNIEPKYGYNYNLDGVGYRDFGTSIGKMALQWMPFTEIDPETKKITKDGFPKFTLQYTKSFKNIFDADFNFSKTDLRVVQRFNYTKPESFSIITFTAGYAHGDTPITDMYHAYPNNINKETIAQRFSVAGINSFETMYFNEFFSDRFSTLIFKHYFEPFHIGKKFNPQLVLINRFAIGNMKNTSRHEGIDFGTLENGYTEAGFEINKLLFGFGLSSTYRYGAYHLPAEEDNIAIKFTFNITL